MSTKIFNGYRLPKFNLDQLMAFNQSLKNDINAKILSNLHQTATEKFINTIDELSVGILNSYNSLDMDRFTKPQSAKNYNILSGINFFLQKRSVDFKKMDFIDPYFPTFEVIYIPIKGKLLALLYTESNVLREIWENHDNVTEYNYFNNTDKPKNISDRSWNRRMIDWDKAFEYSDIPNQSGFSYKFDNIPFVIVPKFDELIKYVPTFEERINTLVPKMFIEGYCKSILSSLTKKEYNENEAKFRTEAKAKYDDRENDSFIMDMLEGLKAFAESAIIKTLTPDFLDQPCNYQKV